MEKITLFDAIVNNTDRKFGHILPISVSEVYGCDHGLTFHSEDKLRTVLWQFSGDQIPDNFLKSLNLFLDHLPESQLSDFLTDNEIFALKNRVTDLIQAGAYPFPSDEWPAVPWPPF